MKKSIKKAWVRALRSGGYTQGRTALHNSHGQFCCLGVLYDIAVDGYWVRRRNDSDWHTSTADGACFLEDDCERLGLTADQEGRLAGMNDDGRSFDEIADWIEANL